MHIPISLGKIPHTSGAPALTEEEVQEGCTPASDQVGPRHQSPRVGDCAPGSLPRAWDARDARVGLPTKHAGASRLGRGLCSIPREAGKRLRLDSGWSRQAGPSGHTQDSVGSPGAPCWMGLCPRGGEAEVACRRGSAWASPAFREMLLEPGRGPVRRYPGTGCCSEGAAAEVPLVTWWGQAWSRGPGQPGRAAPS